MDKKPVERAPRIPLDVEVNCNGNKFVYSKNISASGIALISDTSMEPGQFVQLKFFLPGIGREIKAHCKIVRTAAVSENFHEIGASFWDIEDEDKELLEKFFN
ncbi:MAG: PilZ domain-containing protein [Spirochaetales bacterium]|nr:PilZ domain-containing protein [Spirochaetales bacterium]